MLKMGGDVHFFFFNPICRFCGMETKTVQQIICCSEAMARQRYNVFGMPTVEPKDISTASVRGLCLSYEAQGYWGCAERNIRAAQQA